MSRLLDYKESDDVIASIVIKIHHTFSSCIVEVDENVKVQIFFFTYMDTYICQFFLKCQAFLLIIAIFLVLSCRYFICLLKSKF